MPGEYLQYGGQAIIEGVMMRSPRFFSVACRAPNGEIVLRTEAIEKTWVGKQNWLKKPFLRGTLAILDSMALGVRAMGFASKVQMDPAYQKADAEPLPFPSAKERRTGLFWALLGFLVAAALLAVGLLFGDQIPALQRMNPTPRTILGSLVFGFGALGTLANLVSKIKLARMSEADWLHQQANPPEVDKKIQDAAVAGTMVVSLGLALFLFTVLPNVLGEQLRFAGVQNGTAINAVVETVKGIFIFGYILAISRYKPIQEVFEYHGAEHKAINALEAGQDLTIENAQAQTRLHPRCGTSFIVVVFIVGFVISTLTPRYLITHNVMGIPEGQGNLAIDLLGRLVVELGLLLPIIAGTSYELIRMAGRFRNSALVNFFFKPGLMTQLITTREPDAPKVEVAIAALKAVVDAERDGLPEEPLPVTV